MLELVVVQGLSYRVTFAIKNPNVISNANSNCEGTFLLLHVTSTADIYLENAWFWVTDHELDQPDHNQIIYNGRGVLILPLNTTFSAIIKLPTHHPPGAAFSKQKQHTCKPTQMPSNPIPHNPPTWTPHLSLAWLSAASGPGVCASWAAGISLPTERERTRSLVITIRIVWIQKAARRI
jgi:hypothetical protein